jgi:hypothetical protein
VNHLLGSQLQGKLRIIRKYLTKLERLDRDKRSDLLCKFVNYGLKKSYNIGPWRVSNEKKKIYMVGTRLSSLISSVAGLRKNRHLFFFLFSKNHFPRFNIEKKLFSSFIELSAK